MEGGEDLKRYLGPIAVIVRLAVSGVLAPVPQPTTGQLAWTLDRTGHLPLGQTHWPPSLLPSPQSTVTPPASLTSAQDLSHQ